MVERGPKNIDCAIDIINMAKIPSIRLLGAGGRNVYKQNNNTKIDKYGRAV